MCYEKGVVRVERAFFHLENFDLSSYISMAEYFEIGPLEIRVVTEIHNAILLAYMILPL